MNKVMVNLPPTAIYAPTPRKMSVKVRCVSYNCMHVLVCVFLMNLQRQVKRKAPPPPITSTAATSTSPLSSPTEPLDEPCPVYEVIPEPEEEVYMTIADFQATSAGDGLSFSAGSSMTVVTKNASGWWYVEMGEKEGWVPSSYLERAPKRGSTPTPVLSAVPTPQPVKSSPVMKRQPPQTSKNAALRRSTSEDSLTSKPANTKHVPAKASSPTAKRSWLSNSASHPVISVQHKPAIAITSSPKASVVKASSQEERSPPSARRKHTPAVRSASSDDRTRSQPRLSPRAQNSLTNLNVPRPHVRSHSASTRDGGAGKLAPRERVDTSRVENMQVAELSRVLHQRQTESKMATPRSAMKTPSPSSVRRTELVKKQPDKPKPYTISATAKRTPPKRPEPPKASAIQSAKKTAPPRPSTGPGQKHKAATYTVLCDYSGGEGQLSLKTGQSVEVLEKNSDGWWYVKMGAREGWAPSTFLEEGKAKPQRPANGPSNLQPAQPKVELSKPAPISRPVPKPRRSQATSSSTYRAAVSYQVPAYEDSGIDLVVGRTYEVLEKADGWWFVTDGQKDGWAPSSFLDPA